MFTATLYKKTKFNLLNVPDSEDTLTASASSTKSVPAMDILQLYFNTTLTIRAFEEDVADADFLKLTKEGNSSKSAFYVINSYIMTSGDTIELDIAMEPLLTVGGVGNIAKIDGMVTRHHLKKPGSPEGEQADWDEFYYLMKETTVEDDPYLTPSYPTRLEPVATLFQPQFQYEESPMQYALIVFATVPLEDAVDFRYDVGDPTSGDGLVAEMGDTHTIPVNNFVIYSMYDAHHFTTGDVFGGMVPSANAYTCDIRIINSQQDMNGFKETLSKLAANNLTGIVTQSYYVPAKWLSGSTPTHDAAGNYHYDVDHFLNPNTAYEDIDPMNSSYKATVLNGMKSGLCSAQPLMGNFSDFTFIASASGDKRSYKLEDIIQSDGHVHVCGAADTRPHGGVSFAVRKFGAADNQGVASDFGPADDVINGGSWLTESVNSIGQTGYNLNRLLFNRQQEVADLKTDISIEAGTQKSAGNPFGIFGDVWRAFKEGNASGGPLSGLSQASSAMYGGMFGWDPYESLYTMEGEGNVGRGVVAGNERAITKANRLADKSAELAQFVAANPAQPIAVGQPASADCDVLTYSLVMFRRLLDPRDVEKFIKIQNRFGCKHTTLFEKDFFFNHKNFNYVEMSGANVYSFENTSKFFDSKKIRELVGDALNTGIRVWHTSPSLVSDTGFWTNPYKEGN